MKHVYITGDTHGDNVYRLSYRRYPELKELTKNDILIILGDTGICWPTYEKESKYLFNFLNKTKPFEVWFLAGNHDNYDYMESLPEVEHYGGKMRKIVWDGIVYDKLYAIPNPTVVNIENKSILLIPHAESHDIEIILEADDKKKIKECKRNKKWFRVNHVTWWPQEKLDINELKNLINNNMEYDYILSHDAPGFINKWFKRSGHLNRLISTEGQAYLEQLRSSLTFKEWWHGHFHFDGQWNVDSRLHGIYESIEKLF